MAKMQEKKASKKTTTKQKQTGGSRLKVPKTYKLYMNGAFPRSEAGRYLTLKDQEGQFVANYAWASRKDFRNSMVAARKAQAGWSKRTAFNRSLILYRIAEMLEDRHETFVSRLVKHAGLSQKAAEDEVRISVERLFWYAGWADKYIQVFSSVNPIAGPFFNFSFPEPTGVVTIFTSSTSPLLGLISGLAPVILSGNTSILVVENQAPTIAIDFAEVLATSDVPAGVVNILTGKRSELLPHIASHMDLNAIAVFSSDLKEIKEIQTLAVENVKRVKIFDDPKLEDWTADKMQSLYWILPFIETKTAWHPIGM